MKLFHFYIDAIKNQIFCPVCRDSRGYGIFVWRDSRNIIDILPIAPHAYFENNKNSVENFDNNMSIYGENELEEISGYDDLHKIMIIKSFENERVEYLLDMLDTMNMWRSK